MLLWYLIVVLLYRTLRHFTQCASTRSNHKTQHITHTAAGQIKLLIVKMKLIGAATRPMVVSVEHMDTFYSEFIQQDVTAVLRILIDLPPNTLQNSILTPTQHTTTTYTQLQYTLSNLMYYIQSVCYTPYHTRCKSWVCLLQLLLLTQSQFNYISTGMSTAYGAIGDEILMIWALTMSLTPTLVTALMASYALYGENEVKQHLNVEISKIMCKNNPLSPPIIEIITSYLLVSLKDLVEATTSTHIIGNEMITFVGSILSDTGINIWRECSQSHCMKSILPTTNNNTHTQTRTHSKTMTTNITRNMKCDAVVNGVNWEQTRRDLIQCMQQMAFALSTVTNQLSF